MQREKEIPRLRSSLTALGLRKLLLQTAGEITDGGNGPGTDTALFSSLFLISATGEEVTWQLAPSGESRAPGDQGVRVISIY